MAQEESPFQNEKDRSSEVTGEAGGGSMESFRTTDRERSDLEEEKRRVLDLKKMVEAGRDKLRIEMERFEQEKARSPAQPLDREQQHEAGKVGREWDRLGEEEKKLQAERIKLDVLFDEMGSRKIVLDSEAKEIERKTTELDRRETDLSQREDAFAVKKNELEQERANWDEQRSRQLEELRSLPDKKAECELELANLKLEKMRFEEVKKPLEDEKRHLDAKRKIMDQESEILEQQRKIIEDQKKRLLEKGGLPVESRYELEKPIPKSRESTFDTAGTKASAGPSQFEARHDHLRQTDFTRKGAELDRIRRERQKHREGEKQPVLKAIRPGKSVGKAIRVGKLPADKGASPHPTMTCVSCSSEVPIPPGSASVNCPKCGKEYKIRGGAKPKAPKVGKLIKEGPGPVETPSIQQAPELKVPTPPAGSSASPVPEGGSSSAGDKAKLYEKQGKYFIHCLNPSCKAEIGLSNSSKKRVHCPECGRRNKIQSLE